MTALRLLYPWSAGDGRDDGPDEINERLRPDISPDMDRPELSLHQLHAFVVLVAATGGRRAGRG
jgi:hypothetical protein